MFLPINLSQYLPRHIYNTYETFFFKYKSIIVYEIHIYQVLTTFLMCSSLSFTFLVVLRMHVFIIKFYSELSTKNPNPHPYMHIIVMGMRHIYDILQDKYMYTCMHPTSEF